jgi:NifB/MoaA-like Fe-S oxidoreductase
LAKCRPIKINNVLLDSIAEEAGIEKGDILISINNEEIFDIFDYRFLTVNESLNIEIQKQDGEIWEIEIEKDEYEDLGIEFEHDLIDQAKAVRTSACFALLTNFPKE